MANEYVSPTGSGTKSGADWANAAAFSQMNAMAQKAGSGGTVYLAANLGTYHTASSVNIAQAGVTVTGVNTDGSAGVATFEGSRAAGWTAGGATGNELFRIAKGADNLSFKNIQVNDTGTAFRVTGDVSNLSIDHVNASNVQHFLNDYALASSASITGLKITNASVTGYSKSAIDISYNSSNILIDHVLGDSKLQDGDSFAIGVHLDGTTHDATISNSTMQNATATGAATTYWQGDGFATESGTYNVTFQNDTASNNTDGGFDLKSSHLVLDHTTSSGNGRNYRIWGTDVELKNVVGVDPHKDGGSSTQTQLWVAQGAQVAVSNSSFTDSGTGTKAIYNDGGALTFSNTTLTAATDGITFFGKQSPGEVAALTVAKVASTGLFSIGSTVGAVVSTAPSGSVAAPSGPANEPTSAPAKQTAPATIDPPASPAVELVHHIAATAGSDALTGTDAVDMFFFDNGATKTGADAIHGFASNDLFVTKAQLHDSGNDGLIQLSDHMVIGLGDAASTVKIDGLTKTGVRYLGHTADGFVYGDSATRPGGAKEGLLGHDDTLVGDAKGRTVDKFFFDNAIDQQLGHDHVANFTSRDLLITTVQLGSGAKGSTVDAVNGAFALGHDGLDLGSVAVGDTAGHAVTTLEYAGMGTAANGAHLFYYEAVGSTAAASLVG